MLIHGHGEGAYVWNQIAPYLLNLTVFAVDLSGHGDSDWEPAGRYEIGTYVQDVMGVLAALDLSNISLVGHSLGANIAMRVAAHSRTVSRLALVDFGPYVNDVTRQHAHAKFGSQFRAYPHMSDYADFLSATQPLLPPATVWEVASAVLRERGDGTYVLKCDPALASDENQLESSADELLSTLKLIRCPTLLVRGEGSALLSAANAARVARSVGNVRVRSISRAGHAVMLDNPEDFRRVVNEFLQEETTGIAP